MRLYIAEKPSLGKAIADVLPKPHKKEDGHIVLGNGDIVSWCIGHLLEQANPDHYDPAYKRWQLDHLPIVPDKWALLPKAKTKKQLTILKRLIKKADELVHAGDPDREGQLLVDEVIEHAGISMAAKRGIKRLLISDLNPQAVCRALGQLRSNQEFVPLSVSALARSRADWLYGMNLTRAYTVQGKNAGFDGLLSVGRVQTPLLGLIVRRDIEIEQFVSKPFYEVLAHIQAQQGQFKAKWQPSEACQPYMDEEGRVLVRGLAENVAGRITDQPATVTAFDNKLKKQAPPLPYNLSVLQIDAAKRFGLSAKVVLDGCQSLYEKHKLITYPRSESRHLPKDHFAQASQVVAAIENNCQPMAKFAQMANCQQKSKAFNDSKVTAHHAIVPTDKKTSANLTAVEQQLYELISRQYLAQFFPHHEYYETKVELNIAGGIFKAGAKQVAKLGWKEMYPTANRNGKKAANKDDDELPESTLPAMQIGDVLHCLQGEVLEKHTQPPQHFTDATLLAAMTGIARFVKDPEIKKVLKEADGLGTEATRAGIIELLFNRQYITKQGKSIVATPTGRGLIQALPEVATVPDLTAQWESVLGQICDKQASYQGFMQSLLMTLEQLINQASQVVPTHLQGLSGKKPNFNKRKYNKGGSKNAGGAKGYKRKRSSSAKRG